MSFLQSVDSKPFKGINKLTANNIALDLNKWKIILVRLMKIKTLLTNYSEDLGCRVKMVIEDPIKSFFYCQRAFWKITR